MTTALRPAIRERIDPVLEAMITRELIGQGTLPQAIPGAQQPGVPLTALVPVLIAALASQPQQASVPRPLSPLEVLFPFLMTTEVAIVARHPSLLKELIELRLQLAPALLAVLARQPQHVPAQQPSPLAILFPVLLASLAMQQQPAQPSPLLSALSCAFASAISGRSEGREREAGEGTPRRSR
jgi:hypothetical protein